ncbi:hypothetical protein CC78DRAFT_576035 [Lojkania enalia]|uniref:Uncharacterized protein n=1 Tax=Lojkania enalia TaxID=147567 RepID=A0A9P4KJM9_9PLEO|nr:hypothetical protein CC78DRAFT_576035 [Didymosphaeria enalia]
MQAGPSPEAQASEEIDGVGMDSHMLLHRGASPTAPHSVDSAVAAIDIRGGASPSPVGGAVVPSALAKLPTLTMEESTDQRPEPFSAVARVSSGLLRRGGRGINGFNPSVNFAMAVGNICAQSGSLSGSYDVCLGFDERGTSSFTHFAREGELEDIGCSAARAHRLRFSLTSTLVSSVRFAVIQAGGVSSTASRPQQAVQYEGGTTPVPCARLCPGVLRTIIAEGKYNEVGFRGYMAMCALTGKDGPGGANSRQQQFPAQAGVLQLAQ